MILLFYTREEKKPLPYRKLCLAKLFILRL